MLTDLNVEIQLTILSPPFEANLYTHLYQTLVPAPGFSSEGLYDFRPSPNQVIISNS